MSLLIDRLEDHDATTALAVLAAAEEAAGVPLVDEAERLRLEGLAGAGSRPAGWYPLVAHLDDEGVGYGAIVVDAATSTASGDAAVTARGTEVGVLSALLAALADAAAVAGAAEVQVWVRHVGPAELAAARSGGYTVERRLAVLGRDLAEGGQVPDAGPGARVRGYRPDEDDEAVVEVLAAAYAGTSEAGWDLEGLRERRGWSWFRPEDLLVVELEDGRLGGIHWLKRRGEGCGEVYNLAIHPEAQGRGFGPVLLAAGLEHLRRVGCHEVLLWVDLANERAVRLYREHGFVTRWEDVALRRALPSPSPR